MRRRRYVLFTALPVLGLLIYGVLPLSSDEFRIEIDLDKMRSKTLLLDSVRSDLVRDSLPNIVVFLADDLGWGDISYNGSRLVRTVHIDQLAREGVNFQRAYVTSSVCSPSRSSIMTGRYQNRFGFEHQIQERYLQNHLMYYGYKWFVDSGAWTLLRSEKVPRQKDIARQGLPPHEITIAELLRSAGYATACIGKWHLGSDEPARPLKRGFDYHYGFYNSHSLYAYEGTQGIVDQKIHEDWTDQFIWGSQRDGSSAVVINDSVILEKEYLTDRIEEESIEFIEKNRDNPFFLFIPFNTPHTPLQVPEELYNEFSHIEDPYKRAYNAMIKSLDNAIGNIHDRIRQLGIEENTLILFLSDNGGATYTHTTDNSPLRGGKITYLEGGVRVTFIFSAGSLKVLKRCSCGSSSSILKNSFHSFSMTIQFGPTFQNKLG